MTAEVIAEKLNMPAKKLTGAANFTQDEFGRVQQFIKDNIKSNVFALGIEISYWGQQYSSTSHKISSSRAISLGITCYIFFYSGGSVLLD